MSDTRDETTDQPMPTIALDSVHVGEALKALIDARTELGIRKYGTPLMTNNGRDARRDALEESVDLNKYLMQRVMELEMAIDCLLECYTFPTTGTASYRKTLDGHDRAIHKLKELRGEHC